MTTRDYSQHRYEPAYAVPPGETLQETIEALGISQEELATRTGLDKKTVSQTIQGSHPLTPEIAIRLERVTGVPSRLWSNMEARYQRRKMMYEKNPHNIELVSVPFSEEALSVQEIKDWEDSREAAGKSTSVNDLLIDKMNGNV